MDDREGRTGPRRRLGSRAIPGLALSAALGLTSGLGTGSAGAQAPESPEAPASGYPTVAVADYVLGCTTANGESREALERCACSIDVIVTLLPYEDYEVAETFLSLGLVTGERGTLFRGSEGSKEAIDRLRRAQIEAELRCF